MKHQKRQVGTSIPIGLYRYLSLSALTEDIEEANQLKCCYVIIHLDTVLFIDMRLTQTLTQTNHLLKTVDLFLIK